MRRRIVTVMTLVAYCAAQTGLAASVPDRIDRVKYRALAEQAKADQAGADRAVYPRDRRRPLWYQRRTLERGLIWCPESKIRHNTQRMRSERIQKDVRKPMNSGVVWFRSSLGGFAGNKANF